MIARDVDATAAGLRNDGDAYRRLMGPVVRDWDRLMPDVLAPFRIPLHPMQALRMARFGLLALQPAAALASRFRGDHVPEGAGAARGRHSRRAGRVRTHPELRLRSARRCITADSGQRRARAPAVILDGIFEREEEGSHGFSGATGGSGGGGVGAGEVRGKTRTYDAGDGWNRTVRSPCFETS